MLRHSRRPVRCVEVFEHAGWRIKLYAIAESDVPVGAAWLGLARALARETLPTDAGAAGRHGAAFVTVHVARMFNQIIVDWWERDNELRHRVFKAAPDAPTAFREITASGEAFCVWELAVIGFEREAWVETVLENPSGPDVGDYLRRQLDGRV